MEGKKKNPPKLLQKAPTLHESLEKVLAGKNRGKRLWKKLDGRIGSALFLRSPTPIPKELEGGGKLGRERKGIPLQGRRARPVSFLLTGEKKMFLWKGGTRERMSE